MTDTTAPEPGARAGRGPVRAVITYVVIAYLLAWACVLPAWFTGGLASPWFGLGAGAMMFAPTIAALVALRWVEHRRWRTDDSERPGIAATLAIRPTGTVGRLLGWIGLAWLVMVGLVLAGFATSWLLGSWQPDMTDFSALAAVLSHQGVPMQMMPPLPLLAALQLLQAVTLGAVLTSVATTGEELGWRGYLYPALLARMPRLPALLLGGVVWGLWHAPVILLGYNYGDPVLGLPMMCGFTFLYGAVLAWLRARSGSVWPAVLGHAVINGLSSAVLITLGDVDAAPDMVWGTPLGLTGWIVPVVVVAFLVWRGRWRPADRPAGPVSPPPAPHRAG